MVRTRARSALQGWDIALVGQCSGGTRASVVYMASQMNRANISKECLIMQLSPLLTSIYTGWVLQEEWIDR